MDFCFIMLHSYLQSEFKWVSLEQWEFQNKICDAWSRWHNIQKYWYWRRWLLALYVSCMPLTVHIVSLAGTVVGKCPARVSQLRLLVWSTKIKPLISQTWTLQLCWRKASCTTGAARFTQIYSSEDFSLTRMHHSVVQLNFWHLRIVWAFQMTGGITSD